MRLQARIGRPDAVRRTCRMLETRVAELAVESEDTTYRRAAGLSRPAA